MHPYRAGLPRYRCVLALTIMLTGNFTGLNPEVLNTWSNPEVLAINQDPLGAPAYLLNATAVMGSYNTAAIDTPLYNRAVRALGVPLQCTAWRRISGTYSGRVGG